MATPEKYISGEEGLQSPERRPDLTLILGGQAILEPTYIEQPQQEYLPYDGAHPLINETGWMHMDYGQLAEVRHQLSEGLGLLLQDKATAEKNKHWERILALETDFNVLVGKIAWVNGMLRDRRR